MSAPSPPRVFPSAEAFPVSVMARPHYAPDAARRSPGRTGRSAARFATGSGVRAACWYASGVRFVRGNGAGGGRRSLGIVVAPCLRSDQRDFADGVRDAGRARNALLTRLHPAGIDL